MLSRGLSRHRKGVCFGIRHERVQGGHCWAQKRAPGCSGKHLSFSRGLQVLCRHATLPARQCLGADCPCKESCICNVRLQRVHEPGTTLQAIQMKDALPIVADLSGGDAEMQRVIHETIQGLGGLDIIVNKCVSSLAVLFCLC